MGTVIMRQSSTSVKAAHHMCVVPLLRAVVPFELLVKK